ncbi:single-stranded-DNA-specific exonuclease [Desulfovibrionales bacterium]
MTHHWIFRHAANTAVSLAEIKLLATELQISPFLAGLLRQRGLARAADIEQYLSPSLRHLIPPMSWPELQAAAQFIAGHLEQPSAGDTFAIWGDYDVDGVTSTALVLNFLRLRGITARHYLPRRMEDGYGLNIGGIETLAACGVTLLLTVDCGIANVAAIGRAAELGITVIISDHHLPGPELPRAAHTVNPKLSPCPCPDLSHLAGVGVAFLLMAAVNRLLPGKPIDMRNLLDLVALGTLADMVELTGQNRILAKNGMLLLGEASRPGIVALKKVVGYTAGAALNASQIVFDLVPRINAAGRMGDAEAALQLLLTTDGNTARALAGHLDILNYERRTNEKHILSEALFQTKNQNYRLGLVLFSPEWHPGVIGIVASRVVEATNRPVLILCEDLGSDVVNSRSTRYHGDVVLKGSGRSIPEFDLHAGLAACASLLMRFGGHRQAAGFNLAKANLEPLREAFHAAVAEQIGPKPLAPQLKIDAELPFSCIDFTLLKELELLEPFGIGNPTPLFVSPQVILKRLHAFGKDNNHASLILYDPDANVTLRGKAWRQAGLLSPTLTGNPIRVAFSPQIDRYNGLATINLHVKDIKLDTLLLDRSGA